MWFWQKLLSSLVIITSVNTSFICPVINNCKCQQHELDIIEIGCREYDQGLNIKLSSAKTADIVCNPLRIEEHKKFVMIENLLPALNNTIINHLKIYNCSLSTNKSLAELLTTMNMNKVSTLEVLCFQMMTGKFQSNHFYGLNNLLNLKINCRDYKNIPKDLFNQLHQLTHLNLSNNYISKINDETFYTTINLICLDLSYNQLTNISKC